MKTNISMLKLAKNLGSMGLLFTIQKQGVEAIHSDAQVDTDISAMADSLQ